MQHRHLPQALPRVHPCPLHPSSVPKALEELLERRPEEGRLDECGALYVMGGLDIVL